MPVFKKKRNLPYATIDSINQELDRVEWIGVISKVKYSEWTAFIVYNEKKNKHIHFFVDFSTGLNEWVKTYEYPLSSAEDIFAKLNDSKIFSKLDLSNTYLQVMYGRWRNFEVAYN